MRLVPVLTFLLLFAPALARAQDDMGAARERARPIAHDAYLRFEAGDYPAAIDLFRQAEAIYHAPPHLLFIARSQVKLGRIMDAHKSYLAVTSEKLAAYAPDAFRQAQGEAQVELAELRKRIPVVKVIIRGVDAKRVRVSIDATVVTPRPDGHELAPGAHTIVAEQLDGGERIVKRIALAEGARDDVVFELTPPRPARRIEPAPPAEETHSLLVPSLVCFGVSAAALAAGAATGIVSLRKVEAIKERCVDNHCPPADESEADEARALGHASTVLLVVGGAALAAGVTLLIVGWPDDDSAARLELRPDGFVMRGAF